ncbi:MAG TPA: hypothetical protein VFH77_19180 [Streptomyces sp.]|nr:hypothetical protein [Streptomyces sp.]
MLRDRRHGPRAGGNPAHLEANVVAAALTLTDAEADRLDTLGGEQA